MQRLNQTDRYYEQATLRAATKVIRIRLRVLVGDLKGQALSHQLAMISKTLKRIDDVADSLATVD
jgi:hypothetical protein